MKRCIAAVLVSIIMLFVLSACAKQGECESCGQQESLQKFEEKNGDISWYCDDCYRMAKLFT